MKRKPILTKKHFYLILFFAVSGLVLLVVIINMIHTLQLEARFRPMRSQYQAACEQGTQDTVMPGTTPRIDKLLIVYMDGRVVSKPMLHASLKDLVAPSPEEVGTLLCVGDAHNVRIGTYTSGSGGYQIKRNLVLIDMTTGQTTAAVSITGSKPPETKGSLQKGIGDDPIGARLREYVIAVAER